MTPAKPKGQTEERGYPKIVTISCPECRQDQTAAEHRRKGESLSHFSHQCIRCSRWIFKEDWRKVKPKGRNGSKPRVVRRRAWGGFIGAELEFAFRRKWAAQERAKQYVFADAVGDPISVRQIIVEWRKP